MNPIKKIGIIHYRAGRTDGVSLEMEKRKTILQQLGCEVKIISGPLQNGSDFIIEELEFDTPAIREIKENAFAYFNQTTLSPAQLLHRIQQISSQIESAFLQYHQQEKFDALLVHNIFSHGRHIAAASAFTRIAQKTELPIISTNHDYYWEREEYQHPTSPEIQEYLTTYIPPKLPNITHVSINSIARERLLELRGIDSVVFPDIFDFCQPQWQPHQFNSDFLKTIGVQPHDLIVLQATRIVQRKGIELAIHFVEELSRRKREFIGKSLYNGKKIFGDSEIIFLLAGYAEDSAKSYLEKLKREIRRKNIRAKFVHRYIGAQRSAGPPKIYSLWDAYVYADLITYPSLYEGWGNQFIEAVFARKPVVLFEYPVFERDIQPEGYAYISLGNQYDTREDGLAVIPRLTMHKAVESAVKWLLSDETPQILEHNAALGKQFHDYAVMRQFLSQRLICGPERAMRAMPEVAHR